MKKRLSKVDFYDIIKVDKERVEELLYGETRELTKWEQDFLESCLKRLESGRELVGGTKDKLLEIEEE